MARQPVGSRQLVGSRQPVGSKRPAGVPAWDERQERASKARLLVERPQGVPEEEESSTVPLAVPVLARQLSGS